MSSSSYKDFWAVHYASVTEALGENLNQGIITAEILTNLQERLIECQDMIGRYTLSPKSYEEGIKDLIGIFSEDIPKDEHLSYSAKLEGIQADFRKQLLEKTDFTKECFIGDVNHLLDQWKEGKISPSHFKQEIHYYEGVMEISDYYNALRHLEKYLQADLQWHPLLKKVKGLVARVAAQSIVEMAFEPAMSVSTLDGQNEFVLPGVSAGHYSGNYIGPVGDVMNEELENPNQTRLILHRIYVKNSSFESFSVSLVSLQHPIQPTLEMQVFANVYAQENNMHQAVLGLKIAAKHNGDVIWRLQLEEAGFYTLEGFSKEQEENILNGFCMNQLYSHAAVIVTQMVTQGGFSPVYLQPMDFNKLYQEREKGD